MMSVNVVHINDIELICGDRSGASIKSAGAAILHEDGLKIGNEAQAQEKLYPRKLNDRFWLSPGIEPLESVPGYVRHHADLIYHHLSHIHSEMGKPESLALAVPSSMTGEQLSFVLGVAEALPFKVTGMVDAAVAGAVSTGMRGRILHYDLQRHQTVITLLDSAEQVTKTETIVVPDFGLRTIQDKWVNLIADTFMSQSRFDPMHTAESEQLLYNNLGGWIDQLINNNNANMELGNDDLVYRAKIERSKFIQLNDKFVSTLINKGRELDGDASAHLANHHFASILALSEKANQLNVLPATTVVQSVQEHANEIITDTNNLPFVTRLKNLHEDRTAGVLDTSMPAPAGARSMPTHLLVDDTATALPKVGGQLNLVIQDNHLTTVESQADAIATIRNENGSLLLLGSAVSLKLNNKTLDTEAELHSGDVLTTQGGLNARVITVIG